jgi:hypothetical protein
MKQKRFIQTLQLKALLCCRKTLKLMSSRRSRKLQVAAALAAAQAAAQGW